MGKTPYSNLSQTALDSRFQSRVWDKLPFEERLALCQEVENRLAARQGLQPRTVAAQPMDGKLYGYQKGDTLCLNAHVLRDGVFRTAYRDGENNPRTLVTSVPAAGWNTYDTLAHEHTHGAQWDQGRAQTAASYISGSRDYALYRIQPDEREAFAVGQRETLAAIARVEGALGRELPEKGEYLAAVQADSYQEALAHAQMCYGDPGVQQVLDQVVADREQGVAPREPSPTYASITEVYNGPQQALEPEARAPAQEPEDGAAALSGPEQGLGAAGPSLEDGSAALGDPGQGQGPAGLEADDGAAALGGQEEGGADPTGGEDPGGEDPGGEDPGGMDPD